MLGWRRLGFVFCVLAWPGQAALAADGAISDAETSVRLGLTGGYGGYNESVVPQDTESGGLAGGSISASALIPSAFGNFGLPDLYTNAGYDFSAGILRYHGNLQNIAGTPYRADDHAFYNTAIVRLGLGHPMGSQGEVIPYIAGGYQNWYRNVGGPDGLGEFYQAGLVGGGVRFDVAPNPLLVLSASAEGFAVIGGTINAPSENFSGDFGTSAEERVGLDADYRLDHSWHAFAGLGVTHYNYTGSKAGVNGAYEPLSSTLQINSMFGVAYGF